MLPTNVVSFMKKMVSNTEGTSSNQFMSSSNSSGAGAIGRLRQTLQQAHESVSTRLQQNRPGAPQQPSDFPTGEIQTEISQNVNQSTPVEENLEAADNRVCVDKGHLHMYNSSEETSKTGTSWKSGYC